MKIPKNLRFIRGARKLASLKQPPLLFLINLDFLNAIFIMPILLAVFNSQLTTQYSIRFFRQGGGFMISD